MGEIKRALLIINLHKENAQSLGRKIEAELGRRDIGVHSFSFDGQGDFSPDGEYACCFSLGGDGTVLYAARTLAQLGVPILPINLGSLGFIAAVHPDEWLQVFESWLRGEAVLSRRLMLDVWVERQGKIIARETCLNDAVISALGIARLISLGVATEFSSGDKTSRIHLGHYRSDGLIVATPTGSTAYSVAAGGPILDPELAAVIINPLCPFTLSNRPLVVPANETVIVELENEQRSGIILTVDGQVTEALEPRDRIYIHRAPRDALLIASDREGFYKALRTKLNWSGGSLTGGAGNA
ncbi:putative inorganic polyphosphate/ATP-NAD kinase [Treponema primitia ZAS-2]|uniref:NAD kinase n=1 Tax=Treponema primitia (strain ATCC BAA-887 / DSM 12427 / ZAS-2) TaxID=545694 RepID=F5YP66_TREPZ|nr:NAD(+)/NADH kinase [Treponema primitia]AEF84996.1 putative inorganic polyphosphate/ATP-NAD kinase [Treponema primitia ZAS-2]